VRIGSAQLPVLARAALKFVVDQIENISDQIKQIEIELRAKHRQNPDRQRLATIPGFGLIVATVLSATIDSAAQCARAGWSRTDPAQSSTRRTAPPFARNQSGAARDGTGSANAHQAPAASLRHRQTRVSGGAGINIQWVGLQSNPVDVRQLLPSQQPSKTLA